MLEQILTSLSNGLSQSLGWALLAAFAWGVVSIVFSPCHLASVPLIVGFISTQEDASTGRAFRLSLVFSLGVLASIALIGVIVLAGTAAQRVQSVVSWSFPIRRHALGEASLRSPGRRRRRVSAPRVGPPRARSGPQGVGSVANNDNALAALPRAR